MTLKELKGKYVPPHQETSGVNFRPVRVTAKWRNLTDEFKVMEALTDEAFDSWEESLKKRQ